MFARERNFLIAASNGMFRTAWTSLNLSFRDMDNSLIERESITHPGFFEMEREQTLFQCFHISILSWKWMQHNDSGEFASFLYHPEDVSCGAAAIHSPCNPSIYS